MNESKKVKLCDELTYEDYLQHPIWGFSDDDGDEVMPVDYRDHLIWSEGGEALWILGKLILQDQTELPGIIGIRMTDQSLYLLKFIRNDSKLFVFPVNSDLEGKVTLKALSKTIGKPEDQIFPITYITEYRFENGQELSGTYELK